MKKLATIVLLLCLLCAGNTFAQNKTAFKFEGRPMPDWIMGATPEPHNGTYYYKVFEAASSDREDARNQAIKKAFQQAMTFISVGTTTDAVFDAIEKGSSLNVVSETFSIPIYFTCEFSKKTPDGSQWMYWILCQIAIRGNVVPQFDTHFTDCQTHDIWDEMKAKQEQEIKDAERKKNGEALAASMFIPGSGQMLKKQNGKGVAFLLSETVLFGGGVGCYFYGKQLSKKLNTVGIAYDEYKSAVNMKNIMNIGMYSAFGACLALHIFNIVNAYYVKDKSNKQVNLALVPAVIPTNELSTPTYAMGAGVQIKF